MGSGKAEKDKRRRSLEVLVDKQLLIQLRLENLLAFENLLLPVYIFT